MVPEPLGKSGLSRQRGPCVIHIVIRSRLVPKAISVRLDDGALRALARLEASGMSRSEAIRTAILEAADYRRRPDVIRAEAAAIAADPADRAEMAAVLEMMDELSEPW